MHRKQRGCLMAGFLAWSLLVSHPSDAQYTADFQTNIISGVTSNWSGTYYVGNTTFADVLLIQSNGVLNTKGRGVLGQGARGSNNYALVSGPGSVWSNVSGLFIGYYGSGNTLVISNGGRVYSFTGADSERGVGWNTGGHNSVVVTGTGSMWWSTSHDVIRVGGAGVGNSLAIRDGGQVLDGYGDIGMSLFASNNSVLVTGLGSVWSNSGGMEVGGYGSGCSLVISNGGQVFDGGGDATMVGNASSTNWVRVVDGGLWQNTTLTVGNQGSSNSVVIAGGSVSATNVVVGAASPTCNNVLELDSGTVTVTNNGSGVLEVRNGELVVNGGVLQADTLVITNPCAEFIHTGGTLIVSNFVLDPNTFRIVSVAQQSNDVLVTWMMGPGATNTLQASPGDGSGGYSTNGFTDMFIVTNNTIIGTITNYTDIGAATNKPSRYYRARMVP